MLLIIFENFLNTKVQIQHNRDNRDAGPILGGGKILTLPPSAKKATVSIDKTTFPANGLNVFSE